MRLSAGQVAIGAAVTAVIAAVIGGLLVLGSPAEERVRRVDDRRVRDLREIARAMDVHWTRHERLPESLDELSREARSPLTAVDPATDRPYDYRPLGTASYELCATFETDSAESPERTTAYFWSHGAGRQCYELEAEEVER